MRLTREKTAALSFTPRHRRLIVLGCTGSWAFACGALLLALRRHNPAPAADVLVLHDADLTDSDRELIEEFGAVCEPFSPIHAGLSPQALALYSPLCIAKILCFDFLSFYEAVLWLDLDCCIQDSLDEIWEYGALSLAPEDPAFYEDGHGQGAGINVTGQLDGLDPDAPNYNSGVICMHDTLRNRDELRAMSLALLEQHGSILKYPDQAVFNVLVQHLQRTDPSSFYPLPQSYNTHPRNPDELYAKIVHAFGAYKLWNDGLTQACYPEWQRDYARWVEYGGTPWKGGVENGQYARKGTFYLLQGLFQTITRSEQCIDRLSQDLTRERKMRQQLEGILQKLSGAGRGPSDATG